MTKLDSGGCHPWVNAWSDEHQDHDLLFNWHPPAEDIRLTYADPTDEDWHDGVLLARYGQEMTGVYEWKTVNTWRQYRCMMERLCQNCGQSAVDEDGIWWVFVLDPAFAETGELYTNLPPTCKTCIPPSLRTCPRLRKRARICTVDDIKPYAVWADIYGPAETSNGAVRHLTDTFVTLDRADFLRYCLSKQLIVAIDGLRDRQL